jgi:ribosome-associated toxin RatA of RatAB toxin-antitoxin module
MTQVDRSVLVGFTAQQMFSLVDKVEDYPKFLPWCAEASVSKRTEKITLATIRLNYRHFKQSFTTENTKHSPHLIELRLISGPFRHLEGSWRFIELGDAGCKIEFRLRYEFSSKLLEKLLGPAFHHIASSFVNGFIKHAEKVYG